MVFAFFIERVIGLDHRLTGFAGFGTGLPGDESLINKTGHDRT